MIARPESQELLAICLKKLKGLNKVRLIDAHFIWTEPHSKRLRISLTIQKEVRIWLNYPYIPIIPVDLFIRRIRLGRLSNSQMFSHVFFFLITGADIHNPGTNIRDRVSRAVRTMFGLYEIGSEKYMEGSCPGSAESPAQTHVFVLGAAHS
jgi:hypothetical protein